MILTVDYKKIRDLADKIDHYINVLEAFNNLKEIKGLEIYGNDGEESCKVVLKSDVLSFDVVRTISNSLKDIIQKLKTKLDDEVNTDKH